MRQFHEKQLLDEWNIMRLAVPKNGTHTHPLLVLVLVSVGILTVLRLVQELVLGI